MFLRALTLKGFKSFADKTTLEFEPGVTVVVGPNGSGKSNLVDAVAWVLGAQGARSLRGGKMDDVIFAGTSQRPSLGRAEVSLTIDNSAHLLPIDFTEVTITRLLFRSGESEYQINGVPCRLLDIQELLSDSGIGRQQHVIIGQGQIDAILNSRPEDRRLVIEEAAGVLKYRKRREKAERRLESTEGNLIRLNDMLREVRRQLGPLQRQADAARRYDGLVEELRAIRLHLAGTEISGLRGRIGRLRGTRQDLQTRDTTARGSLRDLDVAVLEAEHQLTALGDDHLADAVVRVESLRERTRGLAALVAEKHRGLERELAAAADEGVVETLVADAVGARAELAEVEAAAAALVDLAAEVETADGAVGELQGALEALEAVGPPTLLTSGAGGGLSATDAADALASARRELQALHQAIERSDAEIARVTGRVEAGRSRVQELTSARTAARAAVDGAGAEAPLLEEAATAARSARIAAADALERAETRWREAEGDAGHWRARAEALALALDAARAAAGAEQLRGVDGVIGPLVDHLEIEPGAEDAVTAALGDAIRAVVVQGGAAARDALARLASGNAQALLLVLGDDFDRPAQTPFVPTGSRSLAEFVHCSIPALELALARMLAGTVLVEGDWRGALDLAVANPNLRVLTRHGDRFGGTGLWCAGGEAGGGVTQAALDEAVERAARAASALGAAESAVAAAREASATARDAEAAAEQARRENDDVRAHASAAIERLDGDLAARAQEDTTLHADLDEIHRRHEGDAGRRTELEGELPRLETAAADAVTRQRRAGETRRELERRLVDARALRSRLDVQSAGIDERRAVLQRRLAEVEDRLARNPEQQAAAEARRAELLARAGDFGTIQERLRTHLEAVDVVHERLRARRRAQSERARSATEKLDGLRGVRAELERELTEVRELSSRNEIDEAESRTRLEAAVEKLRVDFDCEPEIAMAAPAPDAPEGTTLAGRGRELDRELRLMGPINPLALEEYDALQERHEFLKQQLDDVKESRRELARVIRAVDQEIQTVFGAAFLDVQENFAQLFGTLFPGGSGRIFLTDPDDLLNTGVEIEARPSGKNTRRLSLLSGGERSLTAMAYLFAIFRARPSPFYLLDEVEAALDDVNLHRFLDLVHEFRDEAQLLIVSHQKRTMEAGDCLYGVSMPPGGSSRVISQRVTERDDEDELVLD